MFLKEEDEMTRERIILKYSFHCPLNIDHQFLKLSYGEYAMHLTPSYSTDIKKLHFPCFKSNSLILKLPDRSIYENDCVFTVYAIEIPLDLDEIRSNLELRLKTKSLVLESLDLIRSLENTNQGSLNKKGDA